jgi:hypothetical protein
MRVALRPGRMARTHHRILRAGASHLSASQLLACSIQRAPNLTRVYSRMHAPTTHCRSCARMLLSPAQLFAHARVRRRRTAAPALAYSSARPWRARHGCSISGQKRIMHARMHAPPTHCRSCARMRLSPTQRFACLHAHACAAAALQLLRSHTPQPALLQRFASPTHEREFCMA